LKDAAYRELHEETGVVLKAEDKYKGWVVIMRVTYYIYETTSENDLTGEVDAREVVKGRVGRDGQGWFTLVELFSERVASG